jgi:hypothetical protein
VDTYSLGVRVHLPRRLMTTWVMVYFWCYHHHRIRLGLFSDLRLRMILVIHICETGGYGVTWKSCSSVSATDANLGIVHVWCYHHHPTRLGLASGLTLRMILVSPICDAGVYGVTWSSCTSASATDANVGNGPHLVLSSSYLLAWPDQWPCTQVGFCHPYMWD